jgi:hypothetical protein
MGELRHAVCPSSPSTPESGAHFSTNCYFSLYNYISNHYKIVKIGENVIWILKINGIVELEAEKLKKYVHKKSNTLSIYGYPYLILRIRGEVERVV